MLKIFNISFSYNGIKVLTPKFAIGFGIRRKISSYFLLKKFLNTVKYSRTFLCGNISNFFVSVHKPIAKFGLKDISLQISTGTIAAVVGPNGSGKTTLLKCINKKLKPNEGAVFVNEKNIENMNNREAAKNIGVVPQVSTVSFPFTVYDFVMMGRYSHKSRFEIDNGNDRRIVNQCLKCTGIAHMEQKLITEMSGGEYQRAVIARALAQQPKILLLDEVTLHLDINHQIEILDLIKALCKKQNLTVVMVLHDLSLAARYSDRIIMLKNGEIFASGTPEEIINTENIMSVYGIKTEICRTVKNNYLNVIPIST